MAINKTATWKEYVVSYRIWGWKDEVIDNVTITEQITDSLDIDKTQSITNSENPRNYNYNEKVYVPAYDENNIFYWKLNSDRQFTKSGSCSKNISNNIDENVSLSSNRKNLKKSVRNNIFMILLENTISIDFHRITTEYPKYDIIKKSILEYEESHGLQLSKVARVVILNMFII